MQHKTETTMICHLLFEITRAKFKRKQRKPFGWKKAQKNAQDEAEMLRRTMSREPMAAMFPIKPAQFQFQLMGSPTILFAEGSSMSSYCLHQSHQFSSLPHIQSISFKIRINLKWFHSIQTTTVVPAPSSFQIRTQHPVAMCLPLPHLSPFFFGSQRDLYKCMTDDVSSLFSSLQWFPISLRIKAKMHARTHKALYDFPPSDFCFLRPCFPSLYIYTTPIQNVSLITLRGISPLFCFSYLYLFLLPRSLFP